MKTMLESIDKGKAENKSPTIKRGLKERMHRLKACDKTLRKTRKKKKTKKKSGNCQHLKASQRLRKENAYQV